MKKIWPFSFYFLYYAAISVYAPYFVLYYQELSFSGAQIGLLTGITPLISLVSVPLWTGVADTTSRHKLVMSLGLLVGVAGLVLLPTLSTFILVISLTTLIYFFFSPVTAFADNASMHMLGGEKDRIGRVRLGGTIGFGICAPLAGLLIERYGLRMAFWGGALLIFGGFLVSQQLSHTGDSQKGAVHRGRVKELVKDPLWLLFLFSAFTCGFAFAGTNTYLFPFLKSLGAKESLMGLALTFGTIAEVPILLFVNRFIKRIEAFSLLLFSMFMTGVRLLLFALVGSPSMALLVQLLNGFNYPLAWVAGVSFADEKAPGGYRATAQGLFSTVGIGLGSSVGGFIGGLILESLGARSLYLIFAAFVFVVTVVVWGIRKKLKRED